jgi:hypothetical protein
LVTQPIQQLVVALAHTLVLVVPQVVLVVPLVLEITLQRLVEAIPMATRMFQVTTNGLTLHVVVLQQTNMVTVLHTTLVITLIVLSIQQMLVIMQAVAVAELML